MGCTVRELQRRMSAREFQEWQEYYKIEPFGDDWEQAGTIAATNVNLWSKKKVKPEQFMPNYKGSARRDPKAIQHDMMLFAKLHNARIEEEEKRKNKCSNNSVNLLDTKEMRSTPEKRQTATVSNGRRG